MCESYYNIYIQHVLYFFNDNSGTFIQCSLLEKKCNTVVKLELRSTTINEKTEISSTI